MLKDTEIRKTKPTTQPVKLFDDRGLYLVITPAGGKLWRFDYRFGGKRKTLALGKYPDVGLADARIRCDEARKLLANDTRLPPPSAFCGRLTALIRQRTGAIPKAVASFGIPPDRARP